jgi:hypothetical protein
MVLSLKLDVALIVEIFKNCFVRLTSYEEWSTVETIYCSSLPTRLVTTKPLIYIQKQTNHGLSYFKGLCRVMTVLIDIDYSLLLDQAIPQPMLVHGWLNSPSNHYLKSSIISLFA